ncbi:MAG: aspartate 1-decarboxylase [Helicobacter sp.]|uniref:aspartate 1-decarboxylase n=1 Tax=Helicobacter sp. 10-6591 TaxID=2004998 RepID=UPI000DCDB199|nr:aspartate 1-decarboxylase [Helicobacter sp. 10-6591]MCI6217285.1 aspartate 1-decarboxylase [Helicobacter sp.]MCI7484555.1 aspartate 1-decarboxylase [Helicobacter sp.]MDD7566983.1 aspartate 1-decarboxylase [Helicobacter sp.]MDY5741196.1 aspartate 1-decarboxylase [Helicobacter sp.]RAX54792.1 aspartate 1-decarboxylase [Helicobacter sp. 10-6591]
MQLQMLYSKIHRAKISDANLNYVGSITIDRNLALAAGFLENMKVDVLNINNGERFSTYVILGDKEGEVCLNGACARKAQVGDIVIIVAYVLLDPTEAQAFKPRIVQVDSQNKILKVE